MSPIRGRTLAVLASAAVLVGGANLAAYAANGSPLLAGTKNTATKTTTLKNSKGTPLSLKAKAGKAPFKVSNTEKVKKLNADLVDGLESSALQTKAYTYNLSGSTASPLIRFAMPGLPGGKYLVNYQVSANVPGGAPFFICALDSGDTFENLAVPSLGAPYSGSGLVTGAGLVDTTIRTYTMTCQTVGGGLTVPSSDIETAQVVFTRVDDVTGGTSASSRSNSPGVLLR